MKSWFVGVVLAFIVNPVLHAGSITSVPNEFSGGNAAIAEHVNENFRSLVTEVNDNAGSIDANTTVISGKQNTVTANCAEGSSIRQINADGTVVCQIDINSDSGGDITGVTAGTGLIGGGETGDVTLSVDTTATDENTANINKNVIDIGTNVSDISNIDNSLTSHAAGSSAHHSKYTDDDAVNAVNLAGIGAVASDLMETIYTGRLFNIPIPAAGAVGTASDTSTMSIPDIGAVSSISVFVKIDLDRGTVSSDKRLELTDPDGVTHVLYDGTQSTALRLTATNTTVPSLASWIGRSPQNDWILTIIDTFGGDAGEPGTLDDGKVTEWSITFTGSNDQNNNALVINKNLVVNGTIKSGNNIQISKMGISRSLDAVDGVTPVINFTDADGVSHSLSIPDPTASVVNSDNHISYQPSATGDSILSFNINSSSSLTCTLFSSEDDHINRSKGLYWATDEGNNAGISAWGTSGRTIRTFSLAKGGSANAIPISHNFASYAIVCL